MGSLGGAERKLAGVCGVTRLVREARDFDRPFARQRHPHGGAGLIFARGPQRVVDHADAAAFGEDGKPRP
jgi:hypothetical protein